MSSVVRLRVPPQLNTRHRRTYEAIFRRPAVHNLAWHDLLSLLDNLADVSESDHDSYRATRGGQEVRLHAPKYKDFATPEDLQTVRRFLEQTEEAGGAPPDTCLLVVIDHQEAKVYRTDEHAAVPYRIAPDDPSGHHRHLHSRHEETDGKRVPERKSYYEAVAVALREADRILIFGSGTGESSAMDQLMANLDRYHRVMAERVVGCVVVDAHHRTEGQLLAQAREIFSPKAG